MRQRALRSVIIAIAAVFSVCGLAEADPDQLSDKLDTGVRLDHAKMPTYSDSVEISHPVSGAATSLTSSKGYEVNSHYSMQSLVPGMIVPAVQETAPTAKAQPVPRIGPINNAAPEPSVWAMAALGTGLLGWALHRRGSRAM